MNDGRQALFFGCFENGEEDHTWYVTTEILWAIELQERQEQACARLSDNRVIFSVILEMVMEINDRGHFTAWFDFAGHIKDISIRIIKGSWKEKGNITVWEAQLSIHGNKVTEQFTDTIYTRREVFDKLDEFLRYHPTKSKK